MFSKLGLWRTLSIVLAVVTVGCANATAQPAKTSPTASALVPALDTRPLKLPALKPTDPCPVSSMQQFASPPGHKLPGYGFGSGSVFLSGQTAWFSGESAVLFVSPDYSGPVVVRGHQLDGPGGMPFLAQQGSGPIRFAADTVSQWRWMDGTISGPPGCYGLQADGQNYTQMIIFILAGGTPPPG